MSSAPKPDTITRGDDPMPSSFDQDLEFWDEGNFSKLWRRLKEEPLIPLGLAATCYALYGATRSIRIGDKTKTNAYFRARVYAQGATLLFLCAGSVYYKEEREKRKYYQGLLGEQRAQEKKDAWIKELEARDQEEQELREHKARRREARKQMERGQGDGGGKTELNRALGEGEMRRLVLGRGASIVEPALWLWRSRRSRTKENEENE